MGLKQPLQNLLDFFYLRTYVPLYVATYMYYVYRKGYSYSLSFINQAFEAFLTALRSSCPFSTGMYQDYIITDIIILVLHL